MIITKLPNPYTGQAGQKCVKQVAPNVGRGYIYFHVGDQPGPNYGVLLSDGNTYDAHITVPADTEENLKIAGYKVTNPVDNLKVHYKHFHITLVIQGKKCHFHYLTHDCTPKVAVGYASRTGKYRHGEEVMEEKTSHSNWGSIPKADRPVLDALAQHFWLQAGGGG